MRVPQGMSGGVHVLKPYLVRGDLLLFWGQLFTTGALNCQLLSCMQACHVPDADHQWKVLRLQGRLQDEYKAVCAWAWRLFMGCTGLFLAC